MVSKQILFMMVVALAACSEVESVSSVDRDRMARCAIYEKVKANCAIPMSALLSNPASYVNTRVSFVGFLAGPARPGTIYLNRESWNIRDKASAVFLAPAEEAVLDVSELKYSYVTVFGTVLKVGQSRQPNIVVVPSEIVILERIGDYSERERSLMLEEQGAQ